MRLPLSLLANVLATAQQSIRRQGAAIYATSEDLALRLTKVSEAVAEQLGSPDWLLEVDDSSSGRRQEITGFGAAWTDATVSVFDELPVSLQEQLIDELFGSDGIGLSLMRHTIGQSDLTPAWLGRWSYDQNSGEPDPSIAHFDLTAQGLRMVVWLARMLAVKPDVTLLGSPWSPPTWMKQDNMLQSRYVDSWVRYMVRYLEAFRDSGVPVDAMTLQNEPLHSNDTAWTMGLNQSQAALLTRKLSSAIAARGLKTSIWAYDHNTDHPEYPEYVMKNAGEEVDAVAWHCYTPDAGWKPLSDFQRAHPGKKQYMTECWTHLQDEGFFELPDFVTGPLQNWASGVMAWTLGGSMRYDVSYPGGCEQCSGIIQVDREAKSYNKTQDYYTLGQFSKFVKKGAVYLSTQGGQIYPDGTGVQATSFLNLSGDRVVVVENKMHEHLHVQVTFSSDGAWTGWAPRRSVSTWVIPAVGSGKASHIAAKRMLYI